MRAELKTLYSSSLPSGETELPVERQDFWVIMKADIGTVGAEGADCFTFYVTSPNFLSKSIAHDECQIGRGLLILNEFDWDQVERAVTTICAQAEGDTWEQIAAYLSRYFHYEFEGLSPD